jgi:hypothetical protein
MQIVIDIDDRVYGLLKYFAGSLGLADKKDDDNVKTVLMRAIVNGTLLPEGSEILTKEAYSDLCMRASKAESEKS